MQLRKPASGVAGPPGPWLSSPERERSTVMAVRVGGVNMLQFCSVSNSLSHTTLSNKVRGLFFWRPVSARLYCVVVRILHASAYVLCEYTTANPCFTSATIWYWAPGKTVVRMVQYSLNRFMWLCWSSWFLFHGLIAVLNVAIAISRRGYPPTKCAPPAFGGGSLNMQQISMNVKWNKRRN